MTDMLEKLSSRERQIMDIIFELKQATAAQIHQRMPDAPSYSAARTMLARMVTKGYLVQTQSGNRYLYALVDTREEIQTSLLSKMVNTFFEGSVTQAVTGLLGLSTHKVSQKEIEDIKRILESAKEGES